MSALPPQNQAATGEVDIPLDAAQAAEQERFRKAEETQICRRIRDLREAGASHKGKRDNTYIRARKAYYSQFDFSKKAAWQSKVWSPEVFSLVEKYIALYSSGLVPSENWFSADDEWTNSPHREHILVEVQRRNLLQAGFYGMVRQVLLDGGLGGTSPIVVGVDSTEGLPQPSLQRWSPLDVVRDWAGTGDWVILRSEVKTYKLREWAKLGLYEEERVEEAIASQRPASLTQTNALPDQKVPTVMVDVWYGTLPEGEDAVGDKRGGIIGPDVSHCVMVNDEILLRPLIPNPWNWGIPVIFGHPLRDEDRVWPAGLVEHVSGLARAVTEILCALMDDLMYAAMPVWQYDNQRIQKADLQRGIYPGKLIGGNMEGGTPLLAPAIMGKVPIEGFNVLALLGKKIQEATGVTEHTSGNPGMQTGGGRATATEINRYLGQSMQIISTMAKDLQQSCFEPLLDCLLSVFAQVTASSPRTWLNPEMVQTLGPESALLLSMMEEEVRAEVLTRGVRFKAKGIAGAVTAGEDLQKLVSFGMMAKQGGPAYFSLIKPRAFMERAAALSRIDPEEVMWSEEELAQMAAQAAAAQAPPMAGGVPGALQPPGPPPPAPGLAPPPAPMPGPGPQGPPMLPAMAGGV